jgi:hypothetical protein
MDKPERTSLGEVVATSHSSFTVESYELNSTPPLGALVAADNVLAVVCSARTEGLGPISAKGAAGDEDGGVYRKYPDLQRTLRSEFVALTVGCYGEDGRTPLYTFPECPARVHYQCRLAPDDELVRFTDRPDYLRILLYTSDVMPASIDQVLIHLIVRAYRARNADRNWLSATAEYLGRQLKGQYDRLLAILKTLDALTPERPTSGEPLGDAVGKVRY